MRSPCGHPAIGRSAGQRRYNRPHPTRGVVRPMLNRYVTLAAACLAAPVWAAPIVAAEPAPPSPGVQPVADAAPAPPPPPDGAVPSGPPGILDTPDGWHLEVVGSNETQLPVAPLTTAISSREYLDRGTFTGKITGGGKTKLTGGIDGGRRADRLRHHLRRDRDQPGCEHHPGHRHSVHRQPDSALRRQPAGQGLPQARHGDHRRHRQEVVQGHLDPHHASPASGSRPTSARASRSSAPTRP